MLQAVTQQGSFLAQAVIAFPPAANSTKQELSAISQLRNKFAAKGAEERIEEGLTEGFISNEEAAKLRNIKSPELRLLTTAGLNQLCTSKSYAEDLLMALTELKIVDAYNLNKIKSEKNPLVQMQLLEDLKYAVFAQNNLEQAKEFGFLSPEVEKKILNCPKTLHRLRYHLTRELADKVDCQMYAEYIIEEAKKLKLLDKPTLDIINALENPIKKYDFLAKEVDPLVRRIKKLNDILTEAVKLTIITSEERKNIDGYPNLSYRERKVESIEKSLNEIKEADSLIEKAFSLKLINEDTYSNLKEKGYQDRVKASSEYKEVVSYCHLSEEIINFALELDIINQEEANKLNDIKSPKERYEATEKYQSLCVERMQAYKILYKALEYNHLKLSQVNALIQSNDQQQILTEAERLQPQNEKAKEVIEALRFCFEYGLIDEYKMKAIREEKDGLRKHNQASKYIEYFKHKEQYTDLTSIVARFANLP